MALSSYTPAQQINYGAPQYGQAMTDYQGMMKLFSKLMGKTGTGKKPGQGLMGALPQMMNYYKPGGGYGQGMRAEAEETVKGGLAKDMGSMVSSGMSSQFGARGASTRAGAELSKLYGNIEDMRTQNWQGSVVPYAQIMSQMANMTQARPSFGQYFEQGKYRPAQTTKIW